MIHNRLRGGVLVLISVVLSTSAYCQIPADVAGIAENAPSSQEPKKTWVNLRAGVVLPDFYKRTGDAIRPPVLDNPLVGFQGGLSIEMGHSRWYGARAEISYVRKGAREVFVEAGNALESTTQLDYAQAVLLPVILKPGFRKIQPFIGFGGYAGYLIQAEQSLVVNGRAAASAPDFGDNFNTLDYGWALSVGCYLGRHPLELRYEAGLADIFQERRIRSSARNQALSLHFSL